MSSSSTRWRDEPLRPDEYEDVARLVRLARRTRSRVVEFAWTFEQEDLRRLRDAVFDWGRPAVGRFRCFDARVLSAINTTLGERDTAFVLNEPKNARTLDCAVSCVVEDDHYRLCGHAPFDVVFGYGLAAFDAKLGTQLRLGDVARSTIATAVQQLGWDLHRVVDPRLKPVRNVLYNLSVAYGINDEPPVTEAATTTDVAVGFQGPFTALEEESGQCLFAAEVASRSGVYLWTVDVASEHRVWYVGQTQRAFGTRMGEHIANFLAGRYSTWNASALAEGRNEVSWRADDGDVRWPQTLPSFLHGYLQGAANVLQLIRLLRFHVAPLEGDAHLHDRVEGALGRHFKDHADALVRDFFAPGIRLPARIPYDTSLRLVLSSTAEIAGLPTELRA